MELTKQDLELIEKAKETADRLHLTFPKDVSTHFLSTSYIPPNLIKNEFHIY